MATLITTKSESAAPRLIGLIGTQGQGKTTCAVSASAGYPNDCSDTVVLAFDLDATVGLEKRGIVVPRYDFSGVSDWTVLEREIKDACLQIITKAKDKTVKNVVVDTVSAFDTILLAYFQTRSRDNFDLYNKIGQWHRWFLMEQLMPLTSYGVRLITTFQPAYKEISIDFGGKEKEGAKQRQQQKNVSEGLEADADKLLSVSGKIAAKLYRTQCSLILPVARSKDPSGYKYWLFPNGAGLGFEYKNRYLNVLSDKEPADLKALYNKIETFNPKT